MGLKLIRDALQGCLGPGRHWAGTAAGLGVAVTSGSISDPTLAPYLVLVFPSSPKPSSHLPTQAVFEIPAFPDTNLT